jgi:hypothetical protein
MHYLYPPDLVVLVKKAWAAPSRFSGQERPPLPSDDALAELLGVAYQTSLLREEGRTLAFRIIFLPRETAKTRKDPHQKSRVAKFTEVRELSVAELRRLAPAADSVRSMICADHDPVKGWVVWALLDIGANWWQFTRHEAGGARVPPINLTLGSPAPGELTISTNGLSLLALRGGTVYQARGSALDSGPVSAHFETGRLALYAETIRRLGTETWSDNDDDYPKRFHDICLSRLLTSICDLSHGGTLILVPDKLSATDSRLSDRVNIKHPCDYDYAWNLMIECLEFHSRYYAAHSLLRESRTPVDPSAYKHVSFLNSRREESDEALGDCFRFIASLSSVDGALVMTDRFRILGFGAEVIAQSPTLREIRRAENPLATESTPISIESYGTRHRSAFRFCSSYEDAIAFIVSSDGGIKATKRIGADVVIWPEVQANLFS